MVAGRERWEFHKRQSGIASHHQGFGLVLFFDDVLSEGSDGIAIELFSPFLLRYKDRVQACNVLVLLYCQPMQSVLSPLPLTMDSADHEFSPSQWNSHRFTPSPPFDSTQDMEYPSPVTSVAPSFQQPAPTSTSTSTPPTDDFSQVESSVGPDRVLTRRQKAALEGRRSSFPAAPRSPQTIRSHTPPASPHRERLSMNVSSLGNLQMPHTYPLTPDSSSTPYSPSYTFPQSQSTQSQLNLSLNLNRNLNLNLNLSPRTHIRSPRLTLVLHLLP
ncbi:hypothetical protein EDD18DRAFT_477945 [Armillaria luteobubalina]|uniref:Uncharacterized protein n=1 Tax=Armillaria luteobubalina TaxID=153913 RepID=A0AA39QKW9_9AGAR|nr:hypothetical protein EDD18DRAFT_477945 [Armillaria luteobubalina]